MPSLSVHYSDQELISQVTKGNQKAFKALMERYGSLVYNFTLKRVSDKALAEDLTQEIFIKVYQGLRSFDSKRAFRPWLLRIANNTVISSQRKANSRLQAVSIFAIQEDDPQKDWADTSQDPSNVAEAEELSESAKQAMMALEDRYRETLQLRYLKELSYSEIATTKGIPINTVKTWIKRGTELLQQQMRGLME